MKRKLVICPICGKVNKLNIETNYQCTYCKNYSSLDESEIVGINESNRKIEYIENCFKKSIITNDKKNIERYIKLLLKADENNIYANYYILKDIQKRIEYLENNNLNDEKLYFILKEDIIKNKKISSEVKKKIICEIKNLKTREALLKYIDNSEEDDLKMGEELISQDIQIIEYEGLAKEKFIGLVLLGASIILSLIISLICTLVVNENCVYGSIVVLGIVPSVLLYIALVKIIDVKNVFIKVLMFILVFYLLTYLMTVHYHETGFINSFKDHFMGIIYAIPDILEVINDNFEEGLEGVTE